MEIIVYEGEKIASSKRSALDESYMDLVKQGCKVIIKPISQFPKQKPK